MRESARACALPSGPPVALHAHTRVGGRTRHTPILITSSPGLCVSNPRHVAVRRRVSDDTCIFTVLLAVYMCRSISPSLVCSGYVGNMSAHVHVVLSSSISLVCSGHTYNDDTITRAHMCVVFIGLATDDQQYSLLVVVDQQCDRSFSCSNKEHIYM